MSIKHCNGILTALPKMWPHFGWDGKNLLADEFLICQLHFSQVYKLHLRKGCSTWPLCPSDLNPPGSRMFSTVTKRLLAIQPAGNDLKELIFFHFVLDLQKSLAKLASVQSHGNSLKCTWKPSLPSRKDKTMIGEAPIYRDFWQELGLCNMSIR